MNTPTRIEVDAATGEKLTRFALSDPELLLAGLEARANWQETSGLDDRTYSLVKVAALIALDAPPAQGPSMIDQLNQLNELRQQGALTDEEFAAAKAKLLG